VINGFSDLMVEVFGEAIGQHARFAVGMAALPGNSAVEVVGGARSRRMSGRDQNRVFLIQGKLWTSQWRPRHSELIATYSYGEAANSAMQRRLFDGVQRVVACGLLAGDDPSGV
jgi:hypothetical protein